MQKDPVRGARTSGTDVEGWSARKKSRVIRFLDIFLNSGTSARWLTRLGLPLVLVFPPGAAGRTFSSCLGHLQIQVPASIDGLSIAVAPYPCFSIADRSARLTSRCRYGFKGGRWEWQADRRRESSTNATHLHQQSASLTMINNMLSSFGPVISRVEYP